MSRTCPLRKESALKISVHETFLHLDVHIRIYKVQKREQTAERIPESGVSKHIARKHLAVVRTVVHSLAGRIHLRKVTREEHAPVEAGIECAQVVKIVILDFKPAEHIVPAVASFSHKTVEVTVSKLTEVKLRLLEADE